MPALPIVSARGPSTPGGDAFVYFAYGSTLDFDALRAWCDEHGYRLPDLTGAKPAVLRRFRLAFNVRSRFWGGAVASLVADPSASVEGVAIPLPAAAREFVRHKEGVSSGLYTEIEVAIEVGGKTVEAIAFRASDDRALAAEESPSPRFLETLIRGATAGGLGPAWIESLRRRAG